MPLETATYINQLEPSNPAGPDRLASGDDHIRLIKAALRATFPNITGPMNLTQAVLNSILGAGFVPFGVIQLWSGTALTVPVGYAICDGSTVAKSDGSGTVVLPDLRGRVPVGATTARAPGTTFGQDSKTVASDLSGAHSHTGAISTGGGHNHALSIDSHILTVAEMPNHKHLNGIGDDQAVLFTRGAAAAASYGSASIVSDGNGRSFEGYTEGVGGDQGHSHTGVAAADPGHTHAIAISAATTHSHQVTVDVTQASISIHYIMKV